MWLPVCVSCVGGMNGEPEAKKKSGMGPKTPCRFFLGIGGGCGLVSRGHSHDTSRIAWAKLLARIAERFPVVCPACGGDIRLIAFIIAAGPVRRILSHVGEPVEPPPASPSRGPPTGWTKLVLSHDDRDVIQAESEEFPVIAIHAL